MTHAPKKHRSRPKRGRKGRKKIAHGSVGAPPGRFEVDADAVATSLAMMVYGEGSCEERPIDDPEEAAAQRREGRVVWLDVQGLGNAELLQRIATLFELHPLALEDTVHTHQRAKVELYPKHVFLVAHMVSHAEDGGVDTEQISLYVGDGFVITFQERPGDAFDPVRERLRKGHGTIRRRRPDYLAYALVDAAVDAYFPLLEQMGDRAEAIEDEVLGDPVDDVVLEIQRVRRDLSTFRRAVWPLREALQNLSRDEMASFIDPETLPFLRDTQDHVLRVLDVIETYRELASGLMETYQSTVSNRMNENMQVMAVVATIFIPLTFIAGVYGMNFDPQASPLNMPETGWYWGYPFALLLMLITGMGLLVYFRKKGWIRSRRRRKRAREAQAQLEADARAAAARRA